MRSPLISALLLAYITLSTAQDITTVLPAAPVVPAVSVGVTPASLVLALYPGATDYTNTSSITGMRLGLSEFGLTILTNSTHALVNINQTGGVETIGWWAVGCVPLIRRLFLPSLNARSGIKLTGLDYD